jgi:RNA polymerase sigma factor (sigma-70 family)
MEGIVRAVQEGDKQAFNRLFESEYPGMREVAVQILGAGPDAEDAAQDAAVTALTRITALRDPAKVRQWLHTLVRERCRARQRSRAPVMVELAGTDLRALDEGDPGADLDRLADRAWVRHGLRHLTPAVLPVALLRYYGAHNSYDEIAARCGIPVGTVRSRLNEARRQLAHVLPLVRHHRHPHAESFMVRGTDGNLRKVRVTSASSRSSDGGDPLFVN